MKARKEYNRLANELIDVIVNEPENDEKKLQIIAQLESLEKNPTEKSLAFIKQAKSAAQFTFFRAQFTRIMNDGDSLVKKGDYSGAVQKFQEGYVLYRDDFDDKKYDSKITKPVLAALDTINRGVSQYEALESACENACTVFLKETESGNYAGAGQAFVKVLSSFRSYAEVRNTIAQGGMTFEKTFDQLQQQDPELTEASFLAFAQRFTLGRINDPDSGIVGAMDASWNGMVDKMKQAVYGAVLNRFSNIVSLVSVENLFVLPGTHNDARADLIPASSFADLGKKVSGLNSLRTENTGNDGLQSDTSFTDSMQFAADMTVELSKRLDDVKRIADTNAAVQTLSALKSDPQQTLPADYSQKQIDAVAVYESLSEKAAAALQAVWFTAEQAKEAESGLSWKTALDLYTMLCSQIRDVSLTGAGGVWATLALYYADVGSSAQASFTIRFTEALKLLNGVEEKTGDSGIITVKKYPAESIGAIQKLQTDISAQKTTLAGYQTVLDQGAAYDSSVPDYVQGKNSLASTIAAMNELIIKCNTLSAQARSQVQLADRARNEAKLRYNEAVDALSHDRFDDARDDIQRARTKYNESLSYQESPELREQSDSLLEKLGAEVVRRENEVIVKEVRTLKNKAKDAYYDGDFESAEQYLVQARTRWAVSNVDEDQEITNLLALVTTALSMKTGRVIPPTAPLYPEMSQILSIAHQYYDQGSQLMKQGKTAEAKTLLDQAKDKLRTLQLVYPLNQEARLLTLRIDQLVDPASFKTMFARKIAVAKEDYKNPQTRQAAYTDLLDLYEINPSYPGLKQLIYDVEIEIGVRQKPVDTTALTRSKALTSSAQKLYDSAGSDESKLRTALTDLDEAIRLNPNNSAAMVLKDRIQTVIGGQAAVVLSGADEAVYQQAIQALQKNNIVMANALVEQLLQKPENRRSAKILELQKKVKALL